MTLSPHFHIGAVEFWLFGLHLLVWLFLWRGIASWLTSRNPDGMIGPALATLVH